MRHIPTPGGLGSSDKSDSIYAPGLSPFTAKEEEGIIFDAFNYTENTTAALGESFMSFRILGGVLNEEMAAAMARVVGEAWPSPHMSLEFNYSVRHTIDDGRWMLQQRPTPWFSSAVQRLSFVVYLICAAYGVLLGYLLQKFKPMSLLKNRINGQPV